ncbi:MAG: NADH-quinone oxidoreductase subunit J [Acidobacteria bacterium]|nr:NADH-quinone oxidoreductase subunit J [Acidobacteriota bacterium]
METLVGIVAAATALIGAIAAVTHRNAVVGVLFLVLNLVSLAVFYVLLSAPFIAALQVILYAGAIMVLFLFIIMLLDLRREEERESGLLQKVLSVIGGGVFFLLLWGAATGGAAPAAAELPEHFGSVESIAVALFTTYLIPFETISVLLLVAMVGAVLLTRKGGR